MKSLFLILILFFGSACGATGIQTNGAGNGSRSTPTGVPSETTATSFATAEAFLNLFALGGDFPPAIVIPDIPEMTDTAFVVTFSPAAVIPLDLNQTPPTVSQTYPVFDLSVIPEAAFPNNLWIESKTRGYLLSSSHVIVFNPSTGAMLSSVSLNAPINLTQGLPYSQPGDCDGDNIPESMVDPGPFIPTFPSALAVHSGKLFVTMANACFDASFESFYIQGILLIFDIVPGAPFLKTADKPFLILPGYNATGITVLNDRLIITSTGDTSLQAGNNIPQTDSFLAEIDPQTASITNLLNLGPVAANFQPLAVNAPQDRGFIGSAAYSEVYEIDLEHFQALRGQDNPIVLYGGQDFISDQEMAFGDQVLLLSSFNHSSVRAVDLNQDPPAALPAELNFAFEENPGVTGTGPMALRPGQPGIDFGGPDLWLLTGSPGTVSAARTY